MDPRFARSREALLSAITALLDDGPLGEISIKRVVGDAGISRPTFYQHFEDLPAAARAAAQDRLSRAFPPIGAAEVKLSEGNIASLAEARVAPILQHLRQCRRFYRHVFDGGANVQFFDDLVAFIAERMSLSGLAPKAGGNSEAHAMGIVLAGGVMWLVIRWLHMDRGAETPNSLARRIGVVISAFQILPEKASC